MCGARLWKEGLHSWCSHAYSSDMKYAHNRNVPMRSTQRQEKNRHLCCSHAHLSYRKYLNTHNVPMRSTKLQEKILHLYRFNAHSSNRKYCSADSRQFTTDTEQSETERVSNWFRISKPIQSPNSQCWRQPATLQCTVAHATWHIFPSFIFNFHLCRTLFLLLILTLIFSLLSILHHSSVPLANTVAVLGLLHVPTCTIQSHNCTVLSSLPFICTPKPSRYLSHFSAGAHCSVASSMHGYKPGMQQLTPEQDWTSPQLHTAQTALLQLRLICSTAVHTVY